MGKKPNEDLNRPRLQFRLRTNDTHHLLCPIRPTTMPHSHPSSNSPLKMPKLRTSKGPPKTSKGQELTTEPFSRLRDEPASMLHRPFLGRGRVGNQNNLRRNASSSSKYYQDLLRLLQTNLLCEE